MTKIPDSWERTAGGVYNMDEYRRQGPELERPEGQARIYDLDYTRSQRDRPEMAAGWDSGYDPITDFQPYHEPADLHSQSDLDALSDAGFHHHQQDRIWRRGVDDDIGTEHFISHRPGFRDSEGKLVPWHVTHDYVNSEGTNYGSARQAIEHADREATRARHEASVFPHWESVI